MDGTVEETEPDVTSEEFQGPSAIGFSHGHVGEMSEPGSTGVFAYRLVHSPQSVRMLDLRLDFPTGVNLVGLGRLFRDLERNIIETAVRGEFERARKGSTGGLI